MLKVSVNSRRFKIMKHETSKEIRELEAQNGDKTNAMETARLHMPSHRCPPDTDACDQNTTERSLRSSPLKTIMPPISMTQDKCVLKEGNDQAIHGSDACLTPQHRRRLHVRLCVSLHVHT